MWRRMIGKRLGDLLFKDGGYKALRREPQCNVGAERLDVKEADRKEVGRPFVQRWWVQGIASGAAMQLVCILLVGISAHGSLAVLRAQ